MRTASIISLLFALAMSVPLLTQADGQTSDEYTEAVNLGLSEFQEKNFPEARVHFARAHALNPNARTLRALGMVYFELKDYVVSARYLSDALNARERALEPDKREQTEKLLQRATAYIAHITLDIAPDTQVAVDGKSTDLSSDNQLVLDVGEHQLEFRAAGRITDRRTLKLQGGEHETLRVRLAEIGSAQAASNRVDTGEAPKRPVYKSPWLWTAIGVVLAGAAAGTVIALKSKPGTESPYLGSTMEPPLRGPSR